MNLGVYLFASFSFLLQLTIAARNYISVEDGITDTEKTSGKINKCDDFIFKDWWAPKANNPEDIHRRFSHVRVVVLQIEGRNNQLAKGRASVIVVYKRLENGQADPERPTAADQVIDENDYPATPLWIASSDKIWHADR